MSIRDRDLESDNGHTISQAEMKEKIEQRQSLRLIDLRDPVELQILRIPEAENIPFHLLSGKIKKWDKNQEIVLICHVGFLSTIAQRMMTQAGFKKVQSLKGGMRSWAKESGSTAFIH